MTLENFRTRSARIMQKDEDFLRLLASLGGYCSVAHAEELKLAETGRRTRGQLRAAEKAGMPQGRLLYSGQRRMLNDFSRTGIL